MAFTHGLDKVLIMPSKPHGYFGARKGNNDPLIRNQDPLGGSRLPTLQVFTRR